MSITRVRALRLRRLHLPPLLLNGLGLSTKVTGARAAAQVCHLALVQSGMSIHVALVGNANPRNTLAREEWGQLALATVHGEDLRGATDGRSVRQEPAGDLGC